MTDRIIDRFICISRGEVYGANPKYGPETYRALNGGRFDDIHYHQYGDVCNGLCSVNVIADVTIQCSQINMTNLRELFNMHEGGSIGAKGQRMNDEPKRIIDHIGFTDKAPMSAVEQAREGWDLEWEGGVELLRATFEADSGAIFWRIEMERQAPLRQSMFEPANYSGAVLDGDHEFAMVRLYAPTITECAAELKASVREMLEEALAALD
jgi:hypothetical protein